MTLRSLLATLLILLPLPVQGALPQAAPPAAEEGESDGAGMTAKPLFVIEAGVRVPPAAPSWTPYRTLLTSRSEAITPPAGATESATQPRVTASPTVRLTLLGRLQLEGG